MGAYLISDCIMPEMTGMDLAKAIRADASVANIPIVLWSVSNDPDIRKQALEAGANQFFPWFTPRETIRTTLDILIRQPEKRP